MYYSKLLNARNAIGPQRLQKAPAPVADDAEKRLAVAMSETNDTAKMRLQAISDLRHSLVKRDMTTSLSRADFAQYLDSENGDIARLYFMIKQLDKHIKESVQYKQVMLQCHRALGNSN